MPPDPADPLVSRARALWQELSAGPAPPSELPAARGWSSPGSSPAPPSWVGVVAVGDAALITAPTDRAAHLCVLTAPDAHGAGASPDKWRARPPRTHSSPGCCRSGGPASRLPPPAGSHRRWATGKRAVS